MKIHEKPNDRIKIKIRSVRLTFLSLSRVPRRSIDRNPPWGPHRGCGFAELVAGRLSRGWDSAGPELDEASWGQARLVSSLQAWLHPSTPGQPSLFLTTWSHSSHGGECVVLVFSDSNTPPCSPKLSYVKECTGSQNSLGSWVRTRGGAASPCLPVAPSLAPAPPGPLELPPCVLQCLRPPQTSVCVGETRSSVGRAEPPLLRWVEGCCHCKEMFRAL